MVMQGRNLNRASSSGTIGGMKLEGPSVRIVAVPIVVASAPREPDVQPVLVKR
jgi:hypothetical protein